MATGAIDSATPYPPTGSDTDTEAGALSLAPALSPKVATNQFVANGWGVNPFPEPDFYLEFIVSPLADTEILFTSVEATLVSANVLHDLGYELRSSVDCYASALDGGVIAINGTETIALDLLAMSAQDGATTFRLYIRDIDMLGSEIGVSVINVFGEPAIGGTSPFVRITPSEFCTSPDSSSLFFLYVDGGYLYTSKHQIGIGGQLWRSADRLRWEPIGLSGLGNVDNELIIIGKTTPGLVGFGGHVYAGTSNTVTGGEIHRSSDLSNWTPVMTGGFGDLDNSYISPEIVHGGYLYAGTRRVVSGAAIWRSADGISWSKTSPDGFGDPDNTGIKQVISFNGVLYASTINHDTGAEIWRSVDGAAWTMVVGGSALSPHTFFIPLAEFGGQLTTGDWQSADGLTWNPVSFDTAPCGGPSFISSLRSTGARLLMVCAGAGGISLEIWASTSGTSWTLMADGGLGDVGNLVSAPTEFDGHIVTSTLNALPPPTNAVVLSSQLPALTVPALPLAALGILAAAVGGAGLSRLRRGAHQKPESRSPRA